MTDRLRLVQHALTVLGIAAAALSMATTRNLRPGARPRSSLPPAEMLTPAGRRYRRAAIACIALMLALAAFALALIIRA